MRNLVAGLLVLHLASVPVGPAPAASAASPEAVSDGPTQKERSAPPVAGDVVAEGDSGLPFLVGGAALLAGVGLSVALKSEADQRYHEYLLTADPDRARSLRNEAQRLDRLSLIGLGLVQVAVVYLFFQFTEEEERPLVPTRGEPLIGVGADGSFRIGVRVTP